MHGNDEKMQGKIEMNTWRTGMHQSEKQIECLLLVIRTTSDQLLTGHLL